MWVLQNHHGRAMLCQCGFAVSIEVHGTWFVLCVPSEPSFDFFLISVSLLSFKIAKYFIFVS